MARDRYGATPLHWAANEGQIDLVELLVARGANVDARDNRGATATAIARVKGHLDIVELLQRHVSHE
jgi:ankyrin repeat protein